MPRSPLSRRLLAGIVVSLLVVACGAGSGKGGGDLRKPDGREMICFNAAVMTGDPRPCAKIFSGAYLAAPWSPRGRQVSLLRSTCYEGAAVASSDGSLCEFVLPLNRGFLDGSGLNREACRERVRTLGGQRQSGTFVATVDLVAVLGELGYRESDFTGEARETLETDRESAYHLFYRDVGRTSEFVERVLGLPVRAGVKGTAPTAR